MSSLSIDRLSESMDMLTVEPSHENYVYINVAPASGTRLVDKQFAKERAQAYTCGRKPYPRSMFITLRNILGKRPHVLDIGCGNGRATIPIKQLWTKDVVGFDNDRQMLNELERVSLQAEAKIETKCGNIADLGISHFRKRRFDAVCAFSSFSLFKDNPKDVLSILSVLKPNGVFIDAGDEGKKNDPLGDLMRKIVKIALDRDLVSTQQATEEPSKGVKTVKTESEALAEHNFIPLKTCTFEADEPERYNLEETFAHFKSREIFKKQKFTISDQYKIKETLTEYFQTELKDQVKEVFSKYYLTIYVREQRSKL